MTTVSLIITVDDKAALVLAEHLNKQMQSRDLCSIISYADRLKMDVSKYEVKLLDVQDH